eukprot:TRINITY_DN4002_c0_g1_i2.p1 TRINITY_DN4002_c0_g1~~TRINITY_DN4002_c0_g1_i2.p1  ORF type:complete len:134 (+),score=0.52 TRINITY_DN4002_c0_g1_i2:152-553(+)
MQFTFWISGKVPTGHSVTQAPLAEAYLTDILYNCQDFPYTGCSLNCKVHRSLLEGQTLKSMKYMCLRQSACSYQRIVYSLLPGRSDMRHMEQYMEYMLIQPECIQMDMKYMLLVIQNMSGMVKHRQADKYDWS